MVTKFQFGFSCRYSIWTIWKSFNPEIEIDFEDLRTNSTASDALKKQEGSYDDLYFNYGLNYDLRDSPYRPTTGYKTSFYQTLPLVSDNQEIQTPLQQLNIKL